RDPAGPPRGEQHDRRPGGADRPRKGSREDAAGHDARPRALLRRQHRAGDLGRRAEHARRHHDAAPRYPARVPPPRPDAAPAPDGAGVPGRLGGLDEPHRPLAAQGRPAGVRRARELPRFSRRPRVLAGGGGAGRGRRRRARRRARARGGVRAAAGAGRSPPAAGLPRRVSSPGRPGGPCGGWLAAVPGPLLKPFFALAVFLSLAMAFADLANVWMLTGGRIVFPVIGTHAYWLAIRGGQFGAASALSLMLVPFFLVVLLVCFRIFDPP